MLTQDDGDLLAKLREGDEGVFTALVEANHAAMLRLARAYTRDETLAEEAVQESWLAALRGLDRFEGRSTLRTWLFGIVINQSKRRAARERRSIPLSSLEADAPAVSPNRFRPAEHGVWQGWWLEYPVPWDEQPIARLQAKETVAVVYEAIEMLPAMQRAVITLRDIEGMSAAEACSALGISETNQRVALHRARSRVRRALEVYLTEDG